MDQAGWRFIVADGIKQLIDVGIADFKLARELAMDQFTEGEVRGYSPLSAEQVKASGIEGTFKKGKNIAEER
jgi:hypothetical protein